MSKRRQAARCIAHLALALEVGLLSARAAQGMTRPRVWIDVPTGGGSLVSGTSVEVHSHAYAPHGVAEGMLVVNGVPYRRDPPNETGASLTEFSQTWVAGEPGEYVLDVVAFDTLGEASSPARVLLSVMAEAPQTATLTRAPTVTPGLTPIPLQAEFWAERTALTAGECTQLQWRVQGASAVSLDGTSVDPEGSRDVCPAASVTYHLLAASLAESIERTVTIAVSPPDTSGPAIANLWHSPQSIWDGSSCGPTSAMISANVSDPSGVTTVELHYRVVKGSEQGAWRVLTMGASGGSSYSRTLGPAELSASLPLYGGGIVEYYIVARDSAGNVSQSGTMSFEAELCFG
ncbi:MAG: hypothetical protein AB1449_03075 [Chloroflexota bacterium]